MTSIDHDSLPLGLDEQRTHFRQLRRISDLIAAVMQHQKRKKALREISMLDEHLLRDIGLNPQDLRDAFENRRSSMLFSPYRMPFERD